MKFMTSTLAKVWGDFDCGGGYEWFPLNGLVVPQLGRFVRCRILR
jgi:hypothetical protein